MQTIERRWSIFRVRYIERDVPPDVLRELHIAYYEGFRAMLDTIRQLADLDEYVARSTLDRLHAEARAFNRTIKESFNAGTQAAPRQDRAPEPANRKAR
ncbi:MAG TPA: hypothetical protein VJU59_10525 [Paraburkholderia sp.]|uniref:hypothetical protein n=1 Tax=Paraburkholderia sp. TaxID=1926495 RepID=UPI002B498A0A|nr:hypothetical protein [Paraburkholderia sp.]HKR40091.1 hypothetical protein [Paraburkholderia sp.]